MTTLRVMMVLEDTDPVISMSATVRPGQPVPTPLAASTVPLTGLPQQVQVDPTFAPVPIVGGSAGQALHAAHMLTTSAPLARTVGPAAFVTRGTIDAADLDAVTQATRDPNGEVTIFADPGIGGAVTCGGDPAVGTTGDVQRLLNIGKLRGLGMDGSNVALAIVDNGINLSYLRSRGLVPRLDYHASWTPQVAVPPGAAPVDHGTMCAYDALIAAPKATLLDHAVLRTTRAGGSVMDGVLSDAVQSFGVLLRLMMLPREERFFHSLVVSNSWGMFHPSWDFPPGHPGRYFENPAHPFNRIVESLAAQGADILFAAGNCGPACPDGRCLPIPVNANDRRISGANGHPDVLCVAGVDTNKDLVGYSTHGPGALSHDKPDLAAYTHFLGSEAFGRGVPDSGTSTACPVAAGVLAALRTLYPYSAGNANRSPATVRQYLRAQSVQPAGVPPGWNAQTGDGIIDCRGFDTAGAVIG